MKKQHSFSRQRTEQTQVFVPCAPELAYCTDCGKNRSTGQCPRIISFHNGGRRIDGEPERSTQKKDQY